MKATSLPLTIELTILTNTDLRKIALKLPKLLRFLPFFGIEMTLMTDQCIVGWRPTQQWLGQSGRVDLPTGLSQATLIGDLGAFMSSEC